jgi:putative nucleotidyltransferase with HDIG domain
MQIMKKSNESQSKSNVDTQKLMHKLSQLEEERKKLHTLLKITKNLTGELQLENLLFKIMEHVKEVLFADRCTIFLFDEQKNELWSKVAMGVIEEIRFPAYQGIAGHVCQTGEVLNIPDAYKDDRFNPEIDKKTGYKTKTILAMPLKNKLNEIIGVFQILNRKDGPFTQENEELLTAISNIAATAIENAKLYEEQKKSFASFIETLSTTLDARDYITAGHSRRVTLYALEIGRLMKLNQIQMETLHYAGLLHDIGKIGVPETVLFKDRKLTEDEYEIIKSHAKLTKSILKKIHFQKKYKNLPEIASSHHERLDGTGYPERLKSDRIPLGGKIIALADVFDALTSRRQFRDRMDLEKVIEIIDRETGTAFEPFVVYNFKFIKLDHLIQILEYGHTAEMDKQEMAKLTEYTLQDIYELRIKADKTETELEIENIFMRYYLRQYRSG